MEGATEVVGGQLKSGSRTSDSWVIRLPTGAISLLTSLFIDDTGTSQKRCPGAFLREFKRPFRQKGLIRKVLEEKDLAPCRGLLFVAIADKLLLSLEMGDTFA